MGNLWSTFLYQKLHIGHHGFGRWKVRERRSSMRKLQSCDPKGPYTNLKSWNCIYQPWNCTPAGVNYLESNPIRRARNISELGRQTQGLVDGEAAMPKSVSLTWSLSQQCCHLLCLCGHGLVCGGERGLRVSENHSERWWINYMCMAMNGITILH